jgi:hypothetical protein
VVLAAAAQDNAAVAQTLVVLVLLIKVTQVELTQLLILIQAAQAVAQARLVVMVQVPTVVQVELALHRQLQDHQLLAQAVAAVDSLIQAAQQVRVELVAAAQAEAAQ